MLSQKYGNGYWIGLTLGVCPGCLSYFHFIPFVFLLAVKDIVLSAWDALYTGMIVLILLIGLCLFFFTGKLSYEVEEAEAPHDLQDAANARKAE